MKKLLMILCIFGFPVFAEDCSYEEQIETLALNMYHEARGEVQDGILDPMIMVAEVTLNRVDSPRYPDTICAVVYQDYQFSWTRVVKDQTPKELEIWEDSLALAEYLILGDVETLNTGATHFLNPDKVSRIPSWVDQFETVGRIGNHVFYKETS